MADKITVKIPNWRPALLNEIMGHWTVSAKRKKADRNIVRTYLHHLKPAITKRRLTVTIVLGKGQRAFDVDAPWKSLLDAIVISGQLVDDSGKWVEIMPLKFERGEMATIIELEDM